MMDRQSRVPVYMALAAVLVLLPACDTKDESAATQTFAVEKSYDADKLAVKLRLSATEITASDRILLEIEAVAPEGEPVTFPEFDDKLGEFHVANIRRSSPRLVDEGQVIVVASYELEPFLPGEYAIPPLEIGHTTQGADATAITTEAIPITVISVVPETEADPDINDIAPPVDLPGRSLWVYVAIAFGILALAAGAYYLWRRRRKQVEEVAPTIPPHEHAYAELEKLLREDLLAKGEVKLFYLRLSNILRHYIEDRFGLDAPESTTEEFLEDLRAGTDFTSEQKALLRRFLEHCDLVKFAKHEPTREEVDLAVDACRTFIDQTKPLPESPLSAPKA